ncbi:MAG: hypothetical protein M1814_000977 [Vezdaea aestivalis]|nr:MAG: hypothetical protein M1814_000977 [Vezdaea aestivalis]
MPPPPPNSQPLQQRILALAKTLQFGWFIGHLTLLFCALRYFLSYITFNWNSKWATFSYRTAFVSAAATYGIVVYKNFRAQKRLGGKGGIMQLISEENAQYLLMALVWLISLQIPLAIVPFSVYSIFHVATYTRTNLIPTFQPPVASGTTPDGKATYKQHPISDMISKFVKGYYERSMVLVAILEIAVWFRCVLSAFIFTKGSWILLIIYTVFLRARFSQSAFIQNAFHQLTAAVDAQVNAQGIPPVVKQAWVSVKNYAKIFHDSTDLRKYVGGAAQPPRKAQ